MQNETKKLRCPMGIPAGILSVLLGLAGIITGIIHKDLSAILLGTALFFIGGPIARMTMMVHSANDRLDEIEKTLKK